MEDCKLNSMSWNKSSAWVNWMRVEFSKYEQTNKRHSTIGKHALNSWNVRVSVKTYAYRWKRTRIGENVRVSVKTYTYRWKRTRIGENVRVSVKNAQHVNSLLHDKHARMFPLQIPCKRNIITWRSIDNIFTFTMRIKTWQNFIYFILIYILYI